MAPEKYWRYGKTIRDEPYTIHGEIGNPQLSPNQSVDCMERVQRSDGSGSWETRAQGMIHSQGKLWVYF
jgi:hypothetical protein